MKIALCFIVSYNNSLIKEQIWREWIEPNKDIINIYIHYEKTREISSDWIKTHIIPESQIVKTSYFHVVPAYMTLLKHALFTSEDNQWFCMLTESCVPAVSPNKFRYLFFRNAHQSIMHWQKPWWNVFLKERANLRHFTEDMRFGHEPWFILTRTDVKKCIGYPLMNATIYKLVCNGGVANESLFAMILYQAKTLMSGLNERTHITNWEKPSSATSPYVFKTGSSYELDYINHFLANNPYAFFLRKIHKDFPDDVIQSIITKNTLDTRLAIFMDNWSWGYLLFAVKLFLCLGWVLYQFRFFVGAFF